MSPIQPTDVGADILAAVRSVILAAMSESTSAAAYTAAETAAAAMPHSWLPAIVAVFATTSVGQVWLTSAEGADLIAGLAVRLAECERRADEGGPA